MAFDALQVSQWLKGRFHEVEDRLHAACRHAGRSRDSVTLVAVTKSVSLEVAALLPSLGILDLAENRPQMLWQRAPALPQARWHFIGHLQRNKVERTVPLACLIHSVDSLRLLEALEAEGGKRLRPVNVLLEIHASGETAKQGFDLEEFPRIIDSLRTMNHVRVKGLMAMAALTENAEDCRAVFRRVRQLKEQWMDKMPGPHSLGDLSMGMSNDFEVAIEEGATLIRLGTVLFEGMPT